MFDKFTVTGRISSFVVKIFLGSRARHIPVDFGGWGTN
jgi:hypothetical protein